MGTEKIGFFSNTILFIFSGFVQKDEHCSFFLKKNTVTDMKTTIWTTVFVVCVIFNWFVFVKKSTLQSLVMSYFS